MSPLQLILLSCVLTAAGQIAFKFGMLRFADTSVGSANLVRHLWDIFTSPVIILGFSLFGLGAVLWLFALAKTDLSYAMPVASLTYLLVLIAGVVLFREPLTAMKVAGTVLVAAGVVMVSWQ